MIRSNPFFSKDDRLPAFVRASDIDDSDISERSCNNSVFLWHSLTRTDRGNGEPEVFTASKNDHLEFFGRVDI